MTRAGVRSPQDRRVASCGDPTRGSCRSAKPNTLRPRDCAGSTGRWPMPRLNGNRFRTVTTARNLGFIIAWSLATARTTRNHPPPPESPAASPVLAPDKGHSSRQGIPPALDTGDRSSIECTRDEAKSRQSVSHEHGHAQPEHGNLPSVPGRASFLADLTTHNQVSVTRAMPTIVRGFSAF